MKYIIILFNLILFSCQFFPYNSTIIIEFPEIPEHLKISFPDIKFLIKYPDKENNIVEEFYYPETHSIEIQYNNMSVIPVTAYPVAGPLILLPAGCIYPYSANQSDSIMLKWEYGLTAEILITLISGGMDLNTFNTERLYNEINLTEVPFKLNKQNIIDAILSGKFRVTDIKLLEEKEIKINLCSGTWFTKNPLADPVIITENKEVNLSFTYGFHILHNSETGSHYDIYIDENIVIIQET